MKKLFLLLPFVAATVASADAQPAKRTSAYNYLSYGELDNAKEAIDAASEHEKTVADAKTWLYRGQIYQGIYESQDPKFKALSDNPLEEAYKAFLKCNELDEKGTHSDVTLKYLDVQSRQFINEGITAYNSKNYPAALNAFENVIAITATPKIQRTDSLAIYYAGACAEQTGDLAKAEKHYRKAIDIDFQAEQAFVRMSQDVC
jgi:tetratricopeptide (TPR) repeat protein